MSKNVSKYADLSTTTLSLTFTNSFYQVTLPRAFLGQLAASKTGYHPVQLCQPCPGVTGSHLHTQQCCERAAEGMERTASSDSLATCSVREQQGQGCTRREDKVELCDSATQHGLGKALQSSVKNMAPTAIQLGYRRQQCLGVRALTSRSM